MKKPPKIFTDHGKVIRCACSAIKFIPISFTVRKIQGLEYKCCTLQCFICKALTTTTKLHDGSPIVTETLNIDELIKKDKDAKRKTAKV